MSQISAYAFKATDRGVVFRPQNFRLYRAAVLAERSGRPGWGVEIPCEYWRPASLKWAANGGISSMRLNRILGAGGAKAIDRPEHLDVSAGDRFRLVESSSRNRGSELFRGCVAQATLAIQANPDFEGASIVAYGPEMLLRATAVTGAWYMTPEIDDAEIAGTASQNDRVRSNVLATNLPAVFNDGGRPNASDANWSLDGGGRSDAHSAVFCSPGRVVRDGDGNALVEARHWDAYTAVRSMLEWFDNGRTISRTATDWAAIERIASVPIGEVNITGLNLLEALRAVLIPVGLGFAVEPWAGPDSAHRLRVFRLHGGAGRSGPFLGDRADPAAASSAAAQRCSVQRLDFTRDNHRIANAVLVVGDRKRCEVSLEYSGPGGSDLQPYWESDDDLDDYADSGVVSWRNWTTQDYRTFCAKYTYGRTGARKHAFRSFAWNEDGALSPVLQDVPDLGSYGIDGRGVRRPRPVSGALSFDEAGRTLPAVVQLGITGDDESWIQVPAHIWADRAGFTLTAATLHDWHPYSGDAARGIQSGGSSLYDLYPKFRSFERKSFICVQNRPKSSLHFDCLGFHD